MLSALSMGLRQMYNRQWVKGGLLLGLQIAYIVVFYPFFNIGLWGIATLGTIPQVDNSLDLMAEGIISILLILFGLGCYGFNIRDAYKVGKLRERGVKPPGVMQTFRHVTDQGFPYLVIGPAMILLVFVVLFPILFMIVLAFTNYDLYHQPPAKLVDYVGLDNFVHLFQLSFWKTSFFSGLCWTVVWTLVSTTVQVILGLFLAVILNQKKLKFKKFFRTILILPWAVPSFVSIIVFSGLFDNNFGTVNLFCRESGWGHCRG